MSASAYPEYPDELSSTFWEKKSKSGWEAKSDLADKLKALHKRSDAIDWKLFAEGWTRSIKTVAELQAEAGKRSKLFGSGVLALKKDAAAAVAAARAAEKKADKELLATLKTIGKAADAYSAAIDHCGEALKQAIENAEEALGDEDDEDSAPSALLDPRALLKQLTLCRKDPERSVKFAYVDGKDKQPALMAVHPRMRARGLFNKLQAAAGVKTGTYGTAWVEGSALMLQLDKPQSGVVKKVRVPVKACGFRIAKVVLWNEDGSVFEQDESPEDTPADAAPAAQPPAAPAAAGTAAAEDPRAAQVQALRKALQPDFERLQRGPLTPALRESFQPFANAWAMAQDSTDKGLHERALLILKKVADSGALRRLRQALEADAAAPAPAPAGSHKPAPSLVVLQGARLVWDGMRKSVQSQFGTIQSAVLAGVRAHNADPEQEDEFDETEVQAQLQALFVSLDRMDRGLIDKLDQALGVEGAQRDARYAEAELLIRQFRGFAASDPMLAFIDDNGFAPTEIRASMDRALGELEKQL
ncbi:hypothetical protein GT347_21845 [Xylophilus rhododendri]|uniref:Uncharacterized protein n=1 Tax=Xylophilus rhododendri TaxID=2697032 RepID=A0A857J9I3_9BURK|nr:hypothetical protein [Xylophilus rhododendri]QHJ00388.1 hypothetical protein GT347_21845 [Xylophilus rhododendri]